MRAEFSDQESDQIIDLRGGDFCRSRMTTTMLACASVDDGPRGDVAIDQLRSALESIFTHTRSDVDGADAENAPRGPP